MNTKADSSLKCLGIDAFNLRAGGGVTHLVELLRAADPLAHGFDRVIVWGGAETLVKIDDRHWLQKVHVPLLDRGLLYRVLWQRFRLRNLAETAGCDVLLVPGGSDASGFKPIVNMSRNMLPFEWREMRRYGWSLYTLKFLILRWTQGRSFRKADAVIFLTQYARDSVIKAVGPLQGKSAIIPHGIHSRFFLRPRSQRRSTDFNDARPCRVLYVSSIDVYKHQWQVADAIAQLRLEGFPVILELVGPPAAGLIRLVDTLNRVDPEGAFITYRGAIPYERLNEFYASADIAVFASSCENMPNILLEGMAAGLPMACSRMGPMPEVLGDAGVYFDPENSVDIANAVRVLITSRELRTEKAWAAYEKAQQYSWQACAKKTFLLLRDTAIDHSLAH